VKIKTIEDFNFRDKTVLVRVDFNSPVDPQSKKILEDTRIRAHGETTIKDLLSKGAKVVVLAHQGRPGEPDFIPLDQHAQILSEILGKQAKYVDDLYGEKAVKAIKALRGGEVLVLKNVRTYADEQKKRTADEHAQTDFIRSLAATADFFVNDAFASAHRAHASIVGFTVRLQSVAGRIMERELNALGKALESPEKPCTYILGGAKADDALRISRYVLDNNIADKILTGGIAAQLFLAAKGFELGKLNTQLLEKKKLTPFISGIKELIQQHPSSVETPSDLALDVNGKRGEIKVGQLPTDNAVCDIGAETINHYRDIIRDSKSIVVSGPMGIYESQEFMKGTKLVLSAVAESEAFSLVGGGHTVAAVKQFGLQKQMGYISTAGGALIEFLMGEKLPGVAALESASEAHK
jgi:phosphoglycerate kinase